MEESSLCIPLYTLEYWLRKMKKGTLVKIKDEKSEKGFITGVIVFVYEGTSQISIADIYIFDKNARILAWTKDLEVLNEG